MDDIQAIQALKKGDITGLKVLVEHYQVKALRTIFLMTQDKMLAEDIVQTAFLKLTKSIDSFDTSRRFEPWFMRLLINHMRQTLNRDKRLIQIDSDDFDAFPLQNTSLSPEYEFDLIENITMVKDALQKLSDKHREVIVLRYYLDYSETEIADLIDSPIGTTRSRIFYAHQQLRKMLKSSYEEKSQ